MARYSKADILDQFGGVIKNSLGTTFGPLHDDDNIVTVPRYEKSEFLIPDEIESYLKENRDKFTVFSLNVDSLNKKWDELKAFFSMLDTKNLSFCCIQFQEVRITDQCNCSKFELPNYKLLKQGSICSKKGGLITLVRNDFSARVRENLYKKSTFFEAQFIEVTGPSTKNNKITVANIYRPPRRNNRLITVRSFIKELRPILNVLRNENSYSILSGDYNLNLLKVSQNTGFSEFFDVMAGKDFIPAITLPTRFDKKSCSLIDHIWVNKPSKGALEPARMSSRVFLKKFAKADHVPCLLSLDILEKITPAPKYIFSQKFDDDNIAAFKQDLIASDLLNSINPSPNGDVEETYSTINHSLEQLREKHFPVRKIRFKRHQHKIQPWMTDIILLNTFGI